MGKLLPTNFKKPICTVTGNEQKIRDSHPAKLLYSGDKAKLISSNDKEGFTYLVDLKKLTKRQQFRLKYRIRPMPRLDG